MNNIITPDLSGYGAQVIEENGRFALTYWPYCTKCKSPFQFDADEPFAYCFCGTTEWGDPRPASWIRPELRLGEHYAGLALKDDGTPSHHLVIVAVKFDTPSCWEDSMEWASKNGGDLPTLLEARLIRTYCRRHAYRGCYWLNEQYGDISTYAWMYHFGNGGQEPCNKSHELRAVAVRRIPIGDRNE